MEQLCFQCVHTTDQATVTYTAQQTVFRGELLLFFRVCKVSVIISFECAAFQVEGRYQLFQESELFPRATEQLSLRNMLIKVESRIKDSKTSYCKAQNIGYTAKLSFKSVEFEN
jgi:hypothetical protein